MHKNSLVCALQFVREGTSGMATLAMPGTKFKGENKYLWSLLMLVHCMKEGWLYLQTCRSSPCGVVSVLGIHIYT